jgi:hypothetical protein
MLRPTDTTTSRAGGQIRNGAGQGRKTHRGNVSGGVLEPLRGVDDARRERAPRRRRRVEEEHVGGGLLPGEVVEQVVAAGRLQEALLPHHLLHERAARHPALRWQHPRINKGERCENQTRVGLDMLALNRRPLLNEGRKLRQHGPRIY